MSKSAATTVRASSWLRPPAAPTTAAQRAGAVIASLLAVGATGAATAVASGAPFSAAVADGPGVLIGLALSLIQGANASDRRGRRRYVFVGMILLGLAVAADALTVPGVTGLLLGLGAGITLSAAAAWLTDARVGRIASVGLALAATVAGAVGGALSVVVVVAVLAAAFLATALAFDGFREPRTPVFVMPAWPDLTARPAVVPVLAVVAGIFALRSYGMVVAVLILGGLAALLTVAVGARRRRPSSVPLAAAGPAYDRAVSVFDSSASPKPALATTVRRFDEIRAALATASAAGLTVGMHSTGHAAMGLADLGASALLKVEMDEPVTVDRERRLVRIPAGKAWGDVVPIVHRHGLAVPHGSSTHVGVVGYLTRGGLSAYGRHTGVAANSIESIELVTADGRLIVANRESEPELFWALRGGGGGFGIVTAVTVRAFEPREIVTGTALWELGDATGVAHAWAEWTATAPSAITTSLRILSVPPLPGMPIRLAARPMLVVDGTAVDGDVSARDAAGALLARLHDVASPRLDTWRVADALEVPATHMDPPFSPAHSSAHALLGAGDAGDPDQARGVVGDFIAVAAERTSGVTIAELRQLGGSLAEQPEDAGAVGHYRGAFGWLAIALHGKPGREVADAAIDAQWDRIAEWGTGFTAPTLAVERTRPARSFPDADRTRVDAARQSIDPEGLFSVDVAPGALASVASPELSR